MARKIVFASCNRKEGNLGGHVNGEQADTGDKFVVVAFSSCRKGSHTKLIFTPILGLKTYSNRTGSS